MQKPFQVSPDMLREIDEQVKTTIEQAPHNTLGARASNTSAERRTFDTPNLRLPETRSSNDQPIAAEDAINPSHYRKHPSGIECIEVTRHLNFNIGNAIKYLWRYQDKGDAIENLKKAQWYIDDEIRRLEGTR